MKNKKGFTLVELLAVIAILGVLIGLTVTSFVGIREKTLEKQYENVVERIITAAEKYAQETAIITVSVGRLIEEGYLPADDGNDIYDPRTNETMNCIVINSKLEDEAYVAELGDNLLKEDGMCDTYTVVTDYRICAFNGDECVDIASNAWFSDNVTLGVKKGTELITVGEFKWTSDTGNAGNESTITTNVSASGSSTYKVEVITPDKSHGEATSKINIDKQAPAIVNVEIDQEWDNKDKDVVIPVSDYAGSGVEGVLISDNPTCPNDKDVYNKNIVDNKYVEAKDVGKYYVCVIDKVGNVAGPREIEVTKIDKIPPVIVEKEKTLTYPINTSYKLENNVTVTDEGGSGLESLNIYVNDKLVTNINELSAGVYKIVYVAKDKAGNETRNEEVTLNIFIPEMNLEYTGEEIEYEVPISGKYQINLWGAQGANSGGKGAYISSEVNLTVGDILKINIGGQNGYNGGGIGSSGTYNGGGATTIKLNDVYIIQAAGGGGGTGGSAGGAGNGAGGSNVGSGAGTNGTNGGGGSSSLSYSYSCNCSTCGGGCKSYGTAPLCCGQCEALCFGGVCMDGPSGSYGAPSCPAPCISYYPTYSCGCSTCTSSGKAGNGGKNYTANNVSVKTTINGNQNGNGKAQIKYIMN